MTPPRITLTLITIVALLVPANALARRKASKIERKRVVAAAVAARDISVAQGKCVRVYISSVDRHWASLDFPPPTKACRSLVADGVALFHWRRGHWHFVTAGSSFSCPIKDVPRRVSRDLRVAC